MDDDPYITFSEDTRYAFVEHSQRTPRPESALAWLHLGVTEDEQTLLPHLVGWEPGRARVVGLEYWDEDAGRQLRPGARDALGLWRIEIADAAQLASPRGPADETLLDLLRKLPRHGSTTGTLARAEVLHDAYQDALAQRRRRQAARPSHAPRARLGATGAVILARLFVLIVDALGTDVDRDLRDASRRLRASLPPNEQPDIEARRDELEREAPVIRTMRSDSVKAGQS